MIKDNHFLILERENNIGINSAIKKVRAKNPNLQIHVEVDTVEQLKKILSVPPDWVLLDNMSLNDLKNVLNYVKINVRQRHLVIFLLKI